MTELETPTATLTFNAYDDTTNAANPGITDACGTIDYMLALSTDLATEYTTLSGLSLSESAGVYTIALDAALGDATIAVTVHVVASMADYPSIDDTSVSFTLNINPCAVTTVTPPADDAFTYTVGAVADGEATLSFATTDVACNYPWTIAAVDTSNGNAAVTTSSTPIKIEDNDPTNVKVIASSTDCSVDGTYVIRVSWTNDGVTDTTDVTVTIDLDCACNEVTLNIAPATPSNYEFQFGGNSQDYTAIFTETRAGCTTYAVSPVVGTLAGTATVTLTVDIDANTGDATTYFAAGNTVITITATSALSISNGSADA